MIRSFKICIKLFFLVTLLLSCELDVSQKPEEPPKEYNLIEEIPCYKYACIDEENRKTYRWVNGVEIWVFKNANYEFLKHVERTVKMYDAIVGIELIFRGRHPEYTLENLLKKTEICTIKDNNGEEPDYDVINTERLFADRFEGIIFLMLPDECMDNTEGFAFHALKTPFAKKSKALSVIAISERAINEYRYFYVFAHEFAHALGLKHPSPQDLITGSTIVNPSSPDRLSHDDILVLWYLYASSSRKDKLYPLEVFPFEGNFSFIFSYPDGTFIDTGFWQGVCAVGGMFPYTAFVEKGECRLENTGWINCWGVIGSKDGEVCIVRVIDSLGNISGYAIRVLARGIPEDKK